MTTKTFLRGLLVGAAFLAGAALLGLPTAAADGAGSSFDTPEAAAQAVADACEKNDNAAVVAIFGAGSEDVLTTGDDAAESCPPKFAALVRQALTIEPSTDGSMTILVVGFKKWPFPVPLVKEAGKGGSTSPPRARKSWRAASARTSSRRSTSCARSGPPRPPTRRRTTTATAATSTRRRSSPPPAGTTASPGRPRRERPCPRGAAGRGRQRGRRGAREGRPWKGYFFRILTKQGENAPGGAFDYVSPKGDMIGGSAMIAWPADHGNTGVMTFLVGREGVVYQKDLGEKTAELAAAITSFDPDASWTQVGDGTDAAAAGPACAAPSTTK